MPRLFLKIKVSDTYCPKFKANFCSKFFKQWDWQCRQWNRRRKMLITANELSRNKLRRCSEFAILVKIIILRHFSDIFLIDSVVKIMEIYIELNLFNSPPVAPYFYAKNFIKIEINITIYTLHQNRKIQKCKQRVLPVAYLEPAQHARWSSLWN